MSRKQNQDSKNERRLTKTLSLMVGVFTACVLPTIILVIVPKTVPSINGENITVLARKPASAFITLELAAAIILASNSLWNCFIYSFRNKEFRKDAANLHFKIMSALGFIRFKSAVGSCLYKTVHDGRRRISSVFSSATVTADQAPQKKATRQRRKWLPHPTAPTTPAVEKQRYHRKFGQCIWTRQLHLICC